ncbi:MAG: hypothetical protein HYU97_04645 [Deltaproteobacteria bacterium]|nr:hypothetical protein [Deltaproteobacteria bacterium]
MKFILSILFLFLFTITGYAEESQPTTAEEEIQQINQQLNQSPGSSSVPAKKYFGPFSYPATNQGLAKIIPDISVIGSLATAYFKEEPAGETGHEPARTGFTLQEIEIALQSVIDPYFRADVFLSVSEEGFELEEGYATTLSLPKGLQIKAGKFLLPFGRQNSKHLEQWDFVNAPLVSKYLWGPEGLNELGAEIAYTFPTPFFLQLQGTFSNGVNEESFDGKQKKDFLYQGRLSTSFDFNEKWTLLLGASGAWGFNDELPGAFTQIYGGDLLIRYRPSSYRALTLQAEYLFRDKELASGKAQDGGGYLFANYQFAKRWHAGLRYDQVGWPAGLITREFRVSPDITFNPTEFSRLRLQYDFSKVPGHEANHAAILQLQYTMGPHGAHPF